MFSSNTVCAMQLPSSVIDEHLIKLSPDVVVTSDGDPEKDQSLQRGPLTLAIVQNGRYVEFLGTASVLFPMENIDRASNLPGFIWIVHGKQDSAVPVEGSQVFVERFRSSFPDIEVRFDLQEGDHDFDKEATLQTDWVRDGVVRAKEYWLQSK
jgi:hypothetical protein